MSDYDWLSTTVGIDGPHWVTRAGCRTVLIVVHSMVSCHRLLDVVGYVESDPRVQVMFTVAPDTFNHGVARYLRRLDALVLPWEQATREPFDLALAAAYGGLSRLHAPLVMMAHGAGHGKFIRARQFAGSAPVQPAVYGLDTQRLMCDGGVVASALLLSCESEREILQRQCPQALAVAVVAGDPCFDRLLASLAWRERYRQALEVPEGQELVVLASTWGRDGLFGHAPDLLPRLMDQLPADQFRVGALLHPAVWAAHGRRQVRAWLRDSCEAGLILLDPTEDWRAMLIAADYLIGDHGSVTAYGAALGRPVLRLAEVGAAVAHGSAQDLVMTRAATLDPSLSLVAQLRSARQLDPQAVAAALTSRPGGADLVIRHTMYRLLRLAQPGRHRRATPVPVPAGRLAAGEARW